MIEITKLPRERWKEYRALRLEALKTAPEAFGSAYEEEARHTEERWKGRMGGVLFALSEGKPVGLIAPVFSDRAKTRHIAHLYSFFVTSARRDEGIGRRLLEEALSRIRNDGNIAKVELSVNPSFGAAVRLYKDAGFVVTGRARKELKVGGKFFDLLNMELYLSRSWRRDKVGRMSP